MQTYFNRQEAAEYLRVSARSLDRLALPRSYMGSKPVYARTDLDAYAESTRTTPTPSPLQTRRPTPRRPSGRRGVSRRPQAGADWLKDVMSPLAA